MFVTFSDNITVSNTGMEGNFPVHHHEGCQKLTKVWEETLGTFPIGTESCFEDICKYQSSAIELTFAKEMASKHDYKKCFIALSSADTKKNIATCSVDGEEYNFSMKDIDSSSEENAIDALTDFKSFLKVHWSASWTQTVFQLKKDPNELGSFSFSYKNRIGTIEGQCLPVQGNSNIRCAFIPNKDLLLWQRVKNYFFGFQQFDATYQFKQDLKGVQTYTINFHVLATYYSINKKTIGEITIKLNPKGTFEIKGNMLNEVDLFSFLYEKLPFRKDVFSCKGSVDTLNCNIKHQYSCEGLFSSSFEESDVDLEIDSDQINFSFNKVSKIFHSNLILPDINEKLVNKILCDAHYGNPERVVCSIFAFESRNEENLQLSAEYQEERLSGVNQKPKKTFRYLDGLQDSEDEPPYLINHAKIIQQISLIISRLLSYKK